MEKHLKCFAWKFLLLIHSSLIWIYIPKGDEKSFGFRNLSGSDSCISQCLIVTIWSNNMIWMNVLSLNRRQCLLDCEKKKSHISASYRNCCTNRYFSLPKKIGNWRIILGIKQSNNNSGTGFLSILKHIQVSPSRHIFLVHHKHFWTITKLGKI